ncbi:hypothetical protein OESDEN_03739 [Oesophagostomum dentatum]|uniref:Ribosomal RNA-processing protein 8 n=1 Tax=Oesophagostomum dentatum TaxID=61180 RepID=A0A0B1TLL4_OESDE|nr:hypothetical protein OESDEN_03739 [Oesophagostomum dentatum]
MVKVVEPVAGTEAHLKRAKRRPWRDKVRKKARKEAARTDREKLKTAAQEAAIISVNNNGSVKKKKKPLQREESTNAVEPILDKDVVRDGYKKLEAGRFRFLNEQLYTMTGSEALEYFRQDPDAFRCYHSGFSEQAKKWPTHPLNTIIKWLKAKSNRQVVFDLGCGDAKIAAAVGDIHEVHSFDLVAVNSTVTECDMAHLPVEASTADIVIFCLSLMGTNVIDYIRESRRVLKLG